MSFRGKTFFQGLVLLNALSLGVLLLVLLFISSTAPGPIGQPGSKVSPTLVPEVCAHRHLTLSTRQGTHCLSPKPHAEGNWEEQRLPVPLKAVLSLCAVGVAATVAYASYEDPAQPEVKAWGSINISLRKDSCTTVPAAVGEPTMTVTSVVFDPFYGGSGGLPTSSLLHQVPVDQCALRSDFFTIWYNGGKSRICFANAGFLQLVHPLTNVVKVCSGENLGSAGFLTGSLSGLSLELSAEELCVSPAQLLRERAITVNELSLE
jgi:hypothetical protein